MSTLTSNCPHKTKTKRVPIRERMAASMVLRKFPFNLGIGTDICHVPRVRGILNSPRGQRFVLKILNTDERTHPKIQWLLTSRPEHDQTGALDSEPDPTSHTTDATRERTPSPPRPGPDAEAVEVAATFMAGRWARTFPALNQKAVINASY